MSTLSEELPLQVSTELRILALSSPVHLNLCPPATRLLAYTSLLDWLHPCVTRFPTTSCTPPKSPLFTYAMIVFWLAIQSLHTTLPKGCNLHKNCCWLVLILSLNHIIFIFLYLTPPPPKKTQALYFLFFLIYTDVFLWPAQHPSSHLKSLSYLSNNVFCFTYPDFVFWPAPLDSHIESVCSHGCKIKDRNYFRVRPKNTNVCSELPEKSTRNVFDEVLQLIRHQPCTHTQCFTSICWTQPLRSQKKFGGI